MLVYHCCGCNINKYDIIILIIGKSVWTFFENIYVFCQLFYPVSILNTIGRLIGYRQIRPNLAIGIGKIHYRSTSINYYVELLASLATTVSLNCREQSSSMASSLIHVTSFTAYNPWIYHVSRGNQGDYFCSNVM